MAKFIKTEDGYTFREINGVWTDGDVTFTDPDTLGVGYVIIDQTDVIDHLMVEVSVQRGNGKFSSLGMTPFAQVQGEVTQTDGAYGLFDHFYDSALPDGGMDENKDYIAVSTALDSFGVRAWEHYESERSYMIDESITVDGEVFKFSVRDVEVLEMVEHTEFGPNTLGWYLDHDGGIFCSGHFDDYPEMQALGKDCHVGASIIRLLESINVLYSNARSPSFASDGPLTDCKDELIQAGIKQSRVWYYG